MNDNISVEVSVQKNGRIARLAHKQVTPENAQSTAWVGSIAVGLTVQALTKEGWEGAIYGSGASVAGLLTLVNLLSISVSLPVLIGVGIAGSILGSIRKPSRSRLGHHN